MKKNQTALFIAILVLIMGFAFLYYRQSLQPKISATNQQTSLMSVMQTIKLKNPITLNTQVKSETTTLDLLKVTTKIETKGEGVNAYVVTINGRTASSVDKEYWAFYVNDKPATVSAGSYKLMPNDKILWKIEKFQ